MPTILSSEVFPLALQSHRTFGAGLAELGLITYPDIDRALEFIVEMPREFFGIEHSLLTALQADSEGVDEHQLMQHLAVSESIDIFQGGDLEPMNSSLFSLQECQATWTIPLDCVDGEWHLVTAYYLSSSVRSFWKGRLEAPIRWYVSSFGVVANALDSERLEDCGFFQ
ncbi:MAG: hypothetical protein AAF212_03465 [Verrucomicrobiota bacterium]